MLKRSSVLDVLKSALPPVPWRLRHEAGDTALPRWLGVLALLSAGGSLALAQAPGDAGRTPGGPQDPAYAVGGLTLGARVPFDSAAYREYKCGPSDQFDGFTWCKRIRQDKERRGAFAATYSILHARDGRIAYLNRVQVPGFFGPDEAEQDIQRYSRQLGEQPRTVTMPRRAEFSHGILAAWGKVVLEPLERESLERLLEGRRPTTKGYLIDFIGDFARSAKEGLPIYRLGGGAGFVWVASYDQKRRGTLRFSAVDASAISPPAVATAAPANPTDARPEDAPSIAPSPAPGVDKAEQRRFAEATAVRKIANAPRNLQVMMKGLRAADDFIKTAEETFLAVFNDAPPEEFKDDTSTDAHRDSPGNAGDIDRETAFRNFRQCFFLSDSGCNRTYGILSGVMPTLNPALAEVVAQPEPIREFKYEGSCFFSVTLDIKRALLQKSSDGSYRNDQTGYVAYFLNFNGIDPNSVKIIDAPEFIRIAFEPPRGRLAANSSAHSPEPTNDWPTSPRWQARYDRFVSALIEKTSIKKFVLLEKQKVKEFPSAPVSLLLADVGETTDQEHAWNPINYHEEAQPFAIGRSSLKRFPVLAFEAADADLIATNLNGVIQSCQNDRQ